MLTIRPQKPIDPASIEVIRQVQQCAANLGINILLTGATAKIILLENVYGMSGGRATRDIDFAFAVENWQQFNEFKNRLISTGMFEAHPSIPHRVFFQSELVNHKLTVDLLPFGEVEDNNQIKWPPDMAVVMNVAGYRDALKSAISLEISEDLTISVISIAGLATLKLFAWADRNQTETKDANDFVLVARNYHQSGNNERIYEPKFTDVLTAVEYDPELTGIWLLGHDVKLMCSDETKAQLLGLLSNAKYQQLIEHMARELRHSEDPTKYAESILNNFKNGLMS